MEDLEVIEEVKSGHTEAFAILVNKYHKSLLNFIYRLVGDEKLVEDIGQEVFLKVYRSLPGFDAGRNVPFSAWLFMVARRRCLDELKTGNGRRNVALEVMDELRSDGETAEEALLRQEKRRVLRDALEQLPEPYRTTILKSLQGNSLDEIAAPDGVSIGTVKSRLFRARARLTQLLGDYLGRKGI